MRKVLYLIIGMLLFLSACGKTQLSEECKDLADRLDNARETFDKDWLAWSNDKVDSWIGGTLINISITDYYTVYTFQGLKTTYSVKVRKFGDKEIPYKIGTFYKFHREHEFQLLTSAASSGAFSDINFTALIPLSCRI